jgi:guanine deaminase
MVQELFCCSGPSRKRPSRIEPPIPLLRLSLSLLSVGSLILAETMQRIGIRAFVGKLSMDISTRPTYVEPTHSESIASARSFIDRVRALTSHLPDHERLVEPVLTPRFVPTCSDALLRGLGELAEQTGVRVQSHLAEARDEMKIVQDTRGTNDLEVFERVSPSPNDLFIWLTVRPD